MNLKTKLKWKFVAIIALAIFAGIVSYPKSISFWSKGFDFFNKTKMNLGLDLQGGIHLEYKADVANLDSGKISEALQGVQDVIERRINAFGVGEPLVQTSRSGGDYRVIVELPGIKNIEEAKKMIKETPFLEFKEETELDPQIVEVINNLNAQNKQKAEEILQKSKGGENFEQLAKDNSADTGSKDKGGDLGFVKKETLVPEFDKILFEENLKPGEIYPDLIETQFGWHIIKFIESRGEGNNKEVHAAHILFGKQNPNQNPELIYKSSGLTGKNLQSASVVFSNQGLGEPQVSLKFDAEGTKLFSELTKKNLGKTLAIYLDGKIISAPRVQSEITTGDAVITGNFKVQEAKDLAMRLNQGALPIPLSLVSQQSIEASLGEISLQKSLKAGIIGIAAVIIFMLIFYRLFGLIASFVLIIYTGLMVAIFKISGITLTLSGIAGFILSIGMAVDANILIFERTKEEVRWGRNISGAIDEGFKRAWTSIRDGNVSSIITAIVLIFLGTGFVKGFAVTLIIGVLVSMFTAVNISRTFIRFFIREWINGKFWLIGVNDKKPDKR